MKIFIIAASIFGFLGVALGAFGAHGLEGRVSERALQNWKTAVDYQMYHTAGLFAIGLLLHKFQASSLQAAGWFFIAGIIIFSGSLYVLSLSGIKILGAITPIGGVSFLIGWFLVGYFALKAL